YRSATKSRAFPFKLGESGGGVASVVVVEEAPFRPFALASLFRRLRYALPLLDRRAQIRGQTLQIGALVVERLRPEGDERTMPRHDPLRLDLRQIVGHGEKPEEAPVHDRHMPQEQQIAGEERSRL